jgi:hypothetical protein
VAWEAGPRRRLLLDRGPEIGEIDYDAVNSRRDPGQRQPKDFIPEKQIEIAWATCAAVKRSETFYSFGPER